MRIILEREAPVEHSLRRHYELEREHSVRLSTPRSLRRAGQEGRELPLTTQSRAEATEQAVLPVVAVRVESLVEALHRERVRPEHVSQEGREEAVSSGAVQLLREKPMAVRVVTPQEVQVGAVQVTLAAILAGHLASQAGLVLAVCSSSFAKARCQVQEQSWQTVSTEFVRQEPWREVRRVVGQ